MKFTQWIFIPILGCLSAVPDAGARSYFLPDFQGGAMFSSRSNSLPSSGGSGPGTRSCSDYGLLAAAQSGKTCQSSSPAPGLTCWSCSDCGAEYQYTETDCPSSIYDRGESCGGKYKTCRCKTSIYPTTSTTGGCPEGYVVSTSSSCTDKPDGTTRYKCERDACPGTLSAEECAAQGGRCVESTDAACAGRCQACPTPCEYAKQYEGALDNCELGCAPGKGISGCPELCVAGGCKACTPCGSEYMSESALPGNVITESCIDCDGTTKHKPVGCQTNYADINTHWCTAPGSSDCASLGYTLNKTCAGGTILVRCPFNAAYTACL